MGTLSFFEEAKIVFKKNNYLKAAKLFELAIEKDELSYSDQVIALEKIKLIHENLNRVTPLKHMFMLAKLYSETESHEKGKRHNLELYTLTKQTEFLKHAFQFAVSNGEIREAKEIARQYIKKLILDKRPNDILNFVELAQLNFETSELLLWKVEAILAMGDLDALLSVYVAIADDDHLSSFVLQEVLRSAEKKANYWFSNIEMSFLIFKELCSTDKVLIISRKLISKLILTIWMEKNIDQDLIRSTLVICDRYDLNFIGSMIGKFLEDYDLADKFETNIPEEMLFENIDLGNDLFNEDIDEEDLIERNILFLESINKKDEINRELEKLRKINPNHKLLKPKDVVSQDSSEIFSSLMKEISKYSNVKENSNELDAYKAMANFYEQDYIQDNYEDMIVGLNLLNLHSVALSVAERVIEEILEQEDIINLYYLKLETLMALKEYYQVRDTVEDMINSYPIKGDELYSLLYIKAEAYYELKQFKQSYYAFSEIDEIKKGYRLTSQRLKELEKYK